MDLFAHIYMYTLICNYIYVRDLARHVCCTKYYGHACTKAIAIRYHDDLTHAYAYDSNH